MEHTAAIDGGLGASLEVPREPEFWLKAWLKRHSFVLGMIGLLFLFALVLFWPRMIITIESGQEGVLWRRFLGTRIDTVYLEGTHLIAPWNKMYIYDVRITRADDTVNVLSADGLEIQVDLSVRYRPVAKTVPQLHQQIGPDYVNRIVLPEVVSAVREIMGRYTPDQLYTLRAVEMQNQILARAATQVRERFVIIDDVLIRRLRLPDVVQAAIQSKLREEQAALEYDYRLEKEKKETARKQLEAQGIASMNAALTDRFLRWKGVEATLELAKSANAKLVVIGSGPNGLPLILNAEGQTTEQPPPSSITLPPVPAAPPPPNQP